MTVTPDQLAQILATVTAPPPVIQPAAKPARVERKADQLRETVPRDKWQRCRDPRCGEVLDPIWWDVGLHANCEAPADDPGASELHADSAHQGEADRIVLPEPASTVTELRQLLIAHDANSARSRQKAIGPSEIGVPCDRQLGMRLHDIPQRPDARVPWAPIQGTAVHAYVADVLRAHNEQLGRQRWLIEERVWPDDMISGSGDAYDLDQDVMIDWKAVGATSLKKYRTKIRPEYRIQAHLYGLGHQRAGRTPKFVRLVYLARDHDYDKSFEWTEPYDQAVAERALERLYRVMNLCTDLQVDDVPAMWGAVPAKPTPDCRWCNWFRPGRPADGTGCPGDTAAVERYASKFTDGLIAP
jgi:hypothetical protein